MLRPAGLVLIFCLGCTAGTSVISAPHVRDGELAFGVGRHHDDWLGDSTAASAAASGRGAVDEVWRIVDGARHIEHCRVEAGRSTCREASFGAEPPEGRLALVDPTWRGGEAEPVAGAPSDRLRAQPGGGVWVRGGGSVLGLYYCRADAVGPACRPVEMGGDAFRPSRLLGVFTLRQGSRASDVVWAVRADREIVRCAAGWSIGEAPAESPSCALAAIASRESQFRTEGVDR